VAAFIEDILSIRLTISYLKNASDSRWRRCTLLKDAHNLPRLLRFFFSVRLAISGDLLFLRWLLLKPGEKYQIGC
jgi:hypothetical protein